MLGGGSVIGGFVLGQGVTSSDPAFLRILATSERYRQAVARQACTFAKSIFLEEGQQSAQIVEREGSIEMESSLLVALLKIHETLLDLDGAHARAFLSM
jgi:hypothetical protein